MIVTCERCATQFQLDDSRVPARGVRVRCSRCKNAFRVVPPGQRAAEEASDLSRRAREDSQEEITQDLDGDSRSRSGSRRVEGSSGKSAGSAHGTTGSGLDTEESDWKFNEDVSAEAEAPIRSTREEPKPEPPPVRRGAEADDWFRGGSDAPLELEDRPWNADAPEAAAPAPEAAPRAASARAPEPEAVDSPLADAEEPSLDRFVEPDEPVSHAEVATETASATAPEDAFGTLPEHGFGEPEAPQKKEAGGSDELASNESWDQLFGKALEEAAGESAAPEAPRKPRRSRSFRLPMPSFGGLGRVGAHVARGLGHGAQAMGWLVTAGLFGVGLHGGFTAQAPAPRNTAAQPVGALELAAVEGRFVENAAGGRLYVVSGRVRNPGSQMEMLAGLEVELLDAAGLPLGSGRAKMQAPIPRSILRESPVADLLGQPAGAVPLAPGEESVVEGVFAELPPDAAAFRVVASKR